MTTDLRKQAETLLQRNPAETPALPTRDVQALIHELQVHQAELEIQNEELRRAQQELVAARPEAVRVSEALRASEERFRSTMDNMLEGCQIIGRDWRYVYINAAAARHNRRPKGDLIGQRYMDVWPGIESTHVFAVIRLCLEERTAQFLENEFTFPDGTVGWFDLSIQPVPEGVFILSMDVTARKRSEDETRGLAQTVAREKDRLAALLNSITDEIWFADAAGKFTLVNPSGAQEFALDTAEPIDVKGLAGRLEVLRPDGSPRRVEEAPPLRALRGEVVRNQEEIIRTPASGELHHRQVSSSPVRDAEGNIIGSVSVVRDITNLKRAEQQLARALIETKQRAGETEAVLAAINDAVLVYDADMNVVRVNRGFIPVYGFDPRGLNVRDIIARTRCRHLDGRPLHLDDQPTPRALHGETVINQDLRITRRDGQERMLETSAAPLAVGERIVGTVTVWHDVTERKQAEEEVRRRAEELRVANEELTLFNRAAVARELRMIELKQEVNAVCAKAGLPPPYALEFEREAGA